MQLKKTGRDDRLQHLAHDTEGDEDAQDYFEDDDLQPVVTPIERTSTTPAAAAAKSESSVDAHSNFDGRFETDQDLRVLGTISGEVICRGTLTIEREAVAKARVEARDALIRGRVDGEIVCSGKLVLAGTAVVIGTVKATTLVVEEGATLKGNIETAGSTAVPRQAPATMNEARAATAPAVEAARPELPARERPRLDERPAEAATPVRNGRRDLPSFAIVSSEERAGLGQN